MPEKDQSGEFTLDLHGMTIKKNGRDFCNMGAVNYSGLNYEQVVAIQQVVIGGLVNLGIKAVEAKKGSK